jgi:hypothetical protein
MKSIFELIEPKNGKKKSTNIKIIQKLEKIDEKIDSFTQKIKEIEQKIIQNIDEKKENLEDQKSLKHLNTQELELIITETESYNTNKIELNKSIEKKNNNQNNYSEISMKNEFDKKNNIKNKIIQFIENKEIKTIELKKEFVDIKNYCSKATFYRYIKELLKEGKIICINIRGESTIFKNSSEINQKI